jgi:hypothetical protein
VVEVCQSRQIDQNESQLERTPAAVLRNIDFGESIGPAVTAFAGLPGVDAPDSLGGHRKVGELKGFERLIITFEQVNSSP